MVPIICAAMFEFDLKRIHHLMPFENRFSTDNNYILEANSLSRVELDTEPLYEINIQKRVLFTTKLRYYAILVEKEINRHLNTATTLLESEDDINLSKFVIKKTREAVTSLVNEANRQIQDIDPTGQYWTNIVSEKPDYKTDVRKKELVVFYHNVIAELSRCWLELQDRYAYVIGKELYDVELFYSSYVKRVPDNLFEIKRTQKYDEESKKFKKGRTDCCFLYDNEDYFAPAIQGFTNTLIRHKMIPEETDLKQMESLFRGHPCRTTYKWIGPPHVLTHIIKGLTKDDNPIITTWPEGTSKWDVVFCRFVNEKGEPLPKNIRTETARKKYASIVEDTVKALAAFL